MIRHVKIIFPALCMAAATVGQSTSDDRLLSDFGGAIRALTARVSPAVVQILVTAYVAGDDDSGRTSNQVSRQRSTASGVLVDPSGYIITNAHVVQGAVKLKVLVSSNQSASPDFDSEPLDGHLLGVDRDSDLALVKVDAKGLPVLDFGDSDLLRQGDLVFAIGSPLGLRNSLSMGVVSSPARAVSDDSPVLFIQTDASINPGNSGGALVDSKGRLVGLNTFIVSQSGGSEGIGFAIPSNVVRNVYEQLRQKGRVSRATAGLFVQDLNPIMVRGLGLKTERGAIVADVTPDGPADKAGMKRRDIVVAVNGKPLGTAREFEDAIYRRKPGDQITIDVRRGDEPLNFRVPLNEQSASTDPLAALASPEKNLVPRLGILCIEIDQDVLTMLPDLRRDYGLIVAAKSPDAQTQNVDLEPGDIIHAVNNTPIALLSVFKEKIESYKRGDAVVLQIERDGRFQYVPFEIE